MNDLGQCKFGASLVAPRGVRRCEKPPTHIAAQGRLWWCDEHATHEGDIPLLPCPICGGVEGCDHSVLERVEAALARRDAGGGR